MDLLNKCLPKLYATTIILFLLHNLLLIKVSQAHSDCLFILGNTANNAYKESLVKKILNEQLSNFDKKAATFRLLTKDAEKWRSLLSEEEQLLTSIEQHHGNPLTIIVVYEGTDEMSLKEITLLSQLIQYAKHFALAEIGKGTTVQTITLLLNTAHCTHTGTLQIDSPNTVFLCNHIQFDDVPLLAPNSIVQNFELPAKILQRKHKNTIHATHTRRDMHYTIQQDLREGSKHKHRRSTKQKIEEMKILAKHARRRQHEPEKIIKLPITQKQLLCKYRKSCYETGIIPTELYTTKVTEMEEAKPEAEEHEVSEGEIKLACKYRKSCYEEFGTQAGKKEEPKKHRVLTGKTRTLTNKEKKKRTLKEIANEALEQVKNQELKRNLLPEPKKIVTERKLNETETKKLQINCKYRKSCYETGERPEVPPKYYIPITISNILPDMYKALKQKNFTELEELEKKTFCHYRKSCYDTGIKPSMKNATQLKIKHVIKKKEEEIPLQIRCKYRKSCYGTKIPPVIEPVEKNVPENDVLPTVIDTLAQLKMHCKYRKSCYQKKLDDHEREEFLKNMEINRKIDNETERDDGTKHVLHEDSSKKSNEKTLDEPLPNEKTSEAPKIENQKLREKLQTKDSKQEKILDENEIKKEFSRKNGQELKAKASNIKAKSKKEGKVIAEIVEDENNKHNTQKKNPTETPKEKSRKASAEKRMKVTEGKVLLAKNGKIDRKQKESEETDQKRKVKQLKKHAPEDASKELKLKIRKQKAREVEDQRKVNKEQKKEEKIKPVSLNHEDEDISKFQTSLSTESDKTPPKKPIHDQYSKTKKKYGESQPTNEHYKSDLEENDDNKKHVNMNNKDDEVEQTPMEDRKYDTSNDNSDDSTDNGSNESKSPENDSDYKLSCKYRKSCYTKGKRYIILKALHQKSESKKKTELHCKYRKSCYETGKRPEINHKLFTQMEELVKKIYGTADSEEPASTEQNKKLFCKYRKSCYNTGKLQLPKLEHLKTLAVTKSDAVNTQLRCKYRKSCYQNSNIVLDKKTEKLKNSAEREVINIETQENRQHVTSFKSNDEKRKGTNEKKVKKDNQHRSNESEDEEDIKKSRKKDKDENKNDHKENKRNTEQILDNEQIYKQIQVNEAEEQLNDKRILNTKDKLSCKYRKRCYDNLDPIDGFKSAAGIELSKHKAAQLISMKGLMRPNGRPCSAYYISCRKLVGLPVRQRPPIGPNGKRLCRKKPKTTTASNIN